MRVSPSFDVSLLTLFTIFFRLTTTLPHLDPDDPAYNPLFDDEDDTSSTASDDHDLDPFVYSVHNSYFGSGIGQISGSSGTSGGSGGSGSSGSASIPIIYPANHPGFQLLHQPDINDWLVPQPGEPDFLPLPPGLPTWPPDWSPSLRIDCDFGPIPDWDYAFPSPFDTFPDPFSGHLTNLCAFHRGSGWEVTPAPPAGRGGLGGYCQELGDNQIVLFKKALADERLWDTVPPSVGQALLATCMRYCECERKPGARVGQKIADQDGWVKVREKDGEDVDVNAKLLGVMVRLGNTEVTLAPGPISPRGRFSSSGGKNWAVACSADTPRRPNNRRKRPTQSCKVCQEGRTCTRNSDCSKRGRSCICGATQMVSTDRSSWTSTCGRVGGSAAFGLGIGVASGLRKRDAMACPCNATYVSQSCCGSHDGLVWEPPEASLGVLQGYSEP